MKKESSRLRRYRIPVMAATLLILAAASLVWQQRDASAQGGQTTIVTVAGGGFAGSVPANQAPMVLPSIVARDPGRGFYVVDNLNQGPVIRFVNTSSNPLTLAGTLIQPNNIGLVAGGGINPFDTAARDAQFGTVSGLTVDPSGNAFYLLDVATGIRAVNVSPNNFSINGRNVPPGQVVSLHSIDANTNQNPKGLALSAAGEFYYIGGSRVFRVSGDNDNPFAGGGTPSQGNGDGGPATSARIVTPMAIAFDTSGNLLIAEGGDARSNPGAVRRVDGSNTITTLAGDLFFPVGFGVAPNGTVYVAVGNAQQIVRIDGNRGTPVAGYTSPVNQGSACDTSVTPTCGDGGPATSAGLNLAGSVDGISQALGADGNGVIIPDLRFGRVRYVNTSGGNVTIANVTVAPNTIQTIVGNGAKPPYDGVAAVSSDIVTPTGVVSDAAGNLYVADSGQGRIRFINRTGAPVTLFPGTGSQQTVQPGQIASLNFNVGQPVPEPDPENPQIPPANNDVAVASFQTPQGLAITANGIFVADSQAGRRFPNKVTDPYSGIVRFINTSGATVTVCGVSVAPGQIQDIAGLRPGPGSNPIDIGDGRVATQAIVFATDVAVGTNGNLYIADPGNNRVRVVDAGSGIINTLFSSLNKPSGVSVDSQGRVYIADTGQNRVVRQDTPGGGNFTSIGGTLNQPRDVTIDLTGNVFVTNAGTNQVLQLTDSGNSVVAGNGSRGYSGDGGPAANAALSLPFPGTIPQTCNIATLPNNNIVFTDTGNDSVRALIRASVAVTTVSSASFAQGQTIAPESLASGFGSGLATTTANAQTNPLPTNLGGTTVTVRDAGNTDRPAGLLFVRSDQVNFQVPAGTVDGPATVTIKAGDGTVSTGSVTVARVSPGLFTANSNGKGVPAAYILRVKPGGATSNEAVATFNGTEFVPVDINLGPPGDQIFLILFGTGIRFNNGLAQVMASIDGAPFPVAFAGPQGAFVGEDQVNLLIPRSLAGHGPSSLILNVEGKPSNTVNLGKIN
jgi:uncharacterized protein (TIGR03437 family)